MTQARADLADLVNRVAYSGERIMLTRHGKPLAALVPVSDLESLERRGDIGFELPRPDVPTQSHITPQSDLPSHSGAPAHPGVASPPGGDPRPGAPGEGGPAPVEDPIRIAAYYRPPRANRPPGD